MHFFSTAIAVLSTTIAASASAVPHEDATTPTPTVDVLITQYNGAGGVQSLTHVNVPINVNYTSKSFSQVGSLIVANATGADVNQATCTPYAIVNGFDFHTELFSKKQSARLESPDSIKVSSVECHIYVTNPAAEE